MLTDTSSCLFNDMQDQFAFRPTGSTTACIVAILKKITELLSYEPFVRLVALDFSKAFDTLRTSALFAKLANLPLDDLVYNWLLKFYTHRQHYTAFNGQVSTPLSINASVIQGSVPGPTSYSINASDLHPERKENSLFKYADDGFLVVPASADDSVDLEIDHISEWATKNNLRLNTGKSVDIIFTKKGCPSVLPQPHPNLRRVSEIKILGVYFTEKLEMSTHISTVESKCAQTLYALKLLRANGLSGQNLHVVCRSLLETRLSYACPSWAGFTTVEERGRLQKILNRAKRWGLNGGKDLPQFSKIVEEADASLFLKICRDEAHVLHSLLPDETSHTHNVRPRPHRFKLSCETTLQRKNFLSRMTFKNVY